MAAGSTEVSTPSSSTVVDNPARRPVDGPETVVAAVDSQGIVVDRRRRQLVDGHRRHDPIDRDPVPSGRWPPSASVAAMIGRSTVSGANQESNAPMPNSSRAAYASAS